MNDLIDDLQSLDLYSTVMDAVQLGDGDTVEMILESNGLEYDEDVFSALYTHLIYNHSPKQEPQSTNNQPTPTKKENKMSQAFQTKHYVYGNDVANMSDDDLISAIARVEKEIEAFSEIKASSVKINARKEELAAMRDAIVAQLDGEVAAAPKAPAAKRPSRAKTAAV